MPKRKIYKEYTGTGASGGNAGDGNSITAPGYPYDDEEEMERYTNKNVYGGDGNHYVGDKSSSTYNNLNRRVKFEEIDADDYGSATLTTQGQMYSKFTKTGRPPGIWEMLKTFEKELKEINGLKEQTASSGGSSDDAQYQRRLKSLQKAVVNFKIQYLMSQQNDASASAADAASKQKTAFADRLKTLQDELKRIETGGTGGGGGAQQKQQQNETIMKDYFKDTQSNLMERMDSYRKEAKRAILMEGAMQQFFEKFDGGMTDEEIIQDYASQGTQVPEQFVSQCRKQYEGYKKLKLELEMSEKEFKNSAKEIVNNPDNESMTEPDAKQLASGLFNEEKEKKEKKEKETKGKINVDTDEVEVLDDVEDIDSVTINIKEQLENFIKEELINIENGNK